MPIGQRVVTRYIKHPSAANGYLADGDPLDAGSAHVIHSNLSHLSYRNVRLVGGYLKRCLIFLGQFIPFFFVDVER